MHPWCQHDAAGDQGEEQHERVHELGHGGVVAERGAHVAGGGAEGGTAAQGKAAQAQDAAHGEEGAGLVLEVLEVFVQILRLTFCSADESKSIIKGQKVF